MIRVTTNGTLRGYKSSLTRSSNTLNSSRNKVLSQSNYNSYAEDPAAATQAFRLRRSFSRTNAQLASTTALNKKYSSACDALSSIKGKLADEQAKISALAGLNDPTASGRQPLGEVLKGAAESIVQTLNAQYGSAFIFGGKDSLGDAPFQLNGSKLTYRGVPVDVMLLPKIKLEMVISKVPVSDVVEAAKKALYTGHIGDGKIFVYDVENVIKVRTGEEGYDALQGTDD